METRGFRIELKPGLPMRVWAARMNQQGSEALATLRGESVILEGLWPEQASAGDYLIAWMRAESFEQTERAVKPASIDAHHRQFKRDTRKSGPGLELPVELERTREQGANHE